MYGTIQTIEPELERIYAMFEGKLVGSFRMQVFVCEVVSQLPADIISYVTANCWFVASLEDAWAFTFTGNDLRDQHLIFLSDELLAQESSQIYFSIAHEIGHVILGHRNSVTLKQSPIEIAQQEEEATAFATQFVPMPTRI